MLSLTFNASDKNTINNINNNQNNNDDNSNNNDNRTYRGCGLRGGDSTGRQAADLGAAASDSVPAVPCHTHTRCEVYLLCVVWCGV